MTIPRSPVVRLTIWYVLIIMAISVFFSAIIYQQTTASFRASFLPHEQVLRTIDPRFRPLFEHDIRELFEERYEVVAVRVRTQLFLLNLGVLACGSVASYFLAKRTLRPIEDALDEQRRFVADASHELRTPLAAMKTEIEVALRRPDPSAHAAVLHSNLEEIGKLERLSSSLLTLARHEDERQRPTFAPVPLASVIDTAWKRVEPLAHRKKITIERDGLTGIVNGDDARLAELFVILLDNAVKYSHAQSVVRVHGVWSRRHATVMVTDQGVGIAPADLPHVFRRFYRADASRSKQGTDGYGLGLAIAKQTAEHHGGTMAIASTHGTGTTVTVVLPRENAKSGL